VWVFSYETVQVVSSEAYVHHRLLCAPEHFVTNCTNFYTRIFLSQKTTFFIAIIAKWQISTGILKKIALAILVKILIEVCQSNWKCEIVLFESDISADVASACGIIPSFRVRSLNPSVLYCRDVWGLSRGRLIRPGVGLSGGGLVGLRWYGKI